MNKFFKLLFFVSIILMSSNLFAKDEKQPLSLVLSAQKQVIKNKDGKQVIELVSLDKAMRNDIILYTIKYTNPGTSPIKDANIVDPIPQGTVYLMDTAAGKDTEIVFSIDSGKNFQKAPVKYMLTKPDGTKEEKIASAEQYTDIKWIIKKSVEPGKSGEVIFKVKVK